MSRNPYAYVVCATKEEVHQVTVLHSRVPRVMLCSVITNVVTTNGGTPGVVGPFGIIEEIKPLPTHGMTFGLDR